MNGSGEGAGELPVGQRRLPVLTNARHVMLPGDIESRAARFDAEQGPYARARIGSRLLVTTDELLAAPPQLNFGTVCAVTGITTNPECRELHLRALARVVLLDCRRWRSSLYAGYRSMAAPAPLRPRLSARLARANPLRESSLYGGFIASHIVEALWATLGDEQRIDRLATSLSAGDAARIQLLVSLSLDERLRVLQGDTRVAEVMGSRRARRTRTTKSRARSGLDDQVSELPQAVQDVLQDERENDGWDRPYAETIRFLTRLNWTAAPQQRIDLDAARAALDASHYGLAEVKDAILDLLGGEEWRRRSGSTGRTHSPICLVGPPGVGKSTIAAAIAAAAGRSLERINMAGADEVYLQGADRSYRRAEAGEIAMRLYRSRLHASQVLFLLDEIDKLTAWDSRPALPSLLLLLDPEQNHAWQDAFLSGVALDLSAAWFITTANDDTLLSPPLKDRVRIIRVPGYTQSQKLEITRSYMVPTVLREDRLEGTVTITDDAVHWLVAAHAATPGMRDVDQRLRAAVARAMREHVETGDPVIIDSEWLRLRFPAVRGATGIGFKGSRDAPTARV